MESSTSSGDPLLRYEIIEKAYCEGRWASVLEAGTVLLRELGEMGDGTDISGLRHRLHLLMGHTLLHGYGDRDAAEDLYTLVVKSDAESTLRQMAEDGLDQCHKPLSSGFVAEEPEAEEEENGVNDRPSLFLPETENGMVDEAPEPQQRDKADPVIVFHPKEPSPAEQEAKPAAGAVLAPRAAKREEEVAAPESGEAADPFRPSRRAARSETLHIGQPVMPWLTSEESAVEFSPEEEPALAPMNSSHAAASTMEPLVPEVVEEPELLEVHQATPSLAEEVELEATLPERLPQSAPEGVSLAEGQMIDLEDLRSSLLLVKLG
ncbi:MAG: hypothetical protein VKO39_09805 [Cyanobacteriota bacterium]|nr:hypothetical protein [Cyanobacteriota bacterium]